MALLEADFKAVFDFTTGEFYLKDQTVPPLSGSDGWDGYITGITDPVGDLIYENNVGGTPDFDYFRDPAPGSGQQGLPNEFPDSRKFDIPKLSTGEYMQGNYIFSVRIIGSGNEYIATKTITITYESPEPDLEVEYNCSLPNFISKDLTDYSKDGASGTVTREHRIAFPKAGIGDFVSTDAEITLTEFYTTVQTVTLTVNLLYNYGEDLTVVDGFTKTKDVTVDCIGDLCDVYTSVRKLYTEYIAAAASNSTHAQNIFQKLTNANTAMSLLKQAINCEKQSDITMYSDFIRKLAKCECGCSEGEPVLVQGGWGEIDLGDTIQSISFDSTTKVLTINTDLSSFSIKVDNYKKVTTIAERDALYADGNIVIGDIVYVSDEDKSYQLKAGGVWEEIGSGSATFNGNREITRSGIPNVNVGGFSIPEFIENFFFPAKQPVITEPSVTMSITGNTTREVGTEITETVTLTLSPGSIMGKLVNGVWQTGTSQGDRSGQASYFSIGGSEILLHPVNSASKSITKNIVYGSNTISGVVEISAGIHPTDSTGNPSKVLSPYPVTSVSKSVNVIGSYKIFFGAKLLSPTTGAEARLLPQSRFDNDGNVFNLNTGSMHKVFSFLCPPSKSLASVIDLDALNFDVTSEYVLEDPAFPAVDANGNPLPLHKLYVKRSGTPYQSNHRHQITIN